jgi:hypothetical protein
VRLFLLFSALCVVSFPAAAQQKGESQIHDYGFGWTNEAAQIDQYIKERSMREDGKIEPRLLHVSLVREDYMDDGDQFAIKLTAPDTVTGCVDFSPIEYEASFIDPYYLDIKVKHYKMEEITSQAPHLECPVSYRRAQALIPLSKKDLQSRGTKQIKFRTDSITEYYNLEIDGAKITLTPQSMAVFKADIDSDSKTIALDMDDTKRLTLVVPMVREGEDVYDQLVSFANTRGLSVEPDTSNVLKTRPDRNSIIVMDANGAMGAMMERGAMQEVGQISISRPVQTPQGVRNTKIPLTVFAKPL